MPGEVETTESTVTTTVTPLAGGGVVETIERHEERPAPEPIIIEPAPEMPESESIASQLAALSEQVTALSARVDDLIALPPPTPPTPAVTLPPESLEDEEDILELEDATELPETKATETKIKPAKEVSDEKPKKKKHAGWFF